jgi:NitT/TauT family transport system substrate-binding protein
MQFSKSTNNLLNFLTNIPVSLKIAFFAVVWLVFISGFHYRLNGEHGNQRVIRMGYMPVIANMACPLLDYACRNNEKLRFRAIKFSSFAEMAEALRNNDIHAAFIIAPLAILLRQQGEDVKVIYIGNRHESTFVAKSNLNIKKFTDLAGITVAVPNRYSGHNLSMLQLIERYQMDGEIKLVEMNPPDMASALATGALSAYYVGEPFAAMAIKNKDAQEVFYAEEEWPGFISNLMLVREDFIQSDPVLVANLVDGAVRSGIWAMQNPEEASKIICKYWNQSEEFIQYSLTYPENRIVYSQYIPIEAELQHMANLMKRFGLSDSCDIDGLVDDRFSKKVSLQNITNVDSILQSQDIAF